MTTTTQFPEVRFAPRRLGHVNLWVGDLAMADAFYSQVCGLHLVFDEPGIEAKFYSNGNSHHDLALMQASDRQHRGRDGHVQVAAGRGRAPGLNHVAFEMATEAELVAALGRADALGFTVLRTVDHQISRSAYVSDPDGLGLELYADAAEPFLATYSRVADQLLTEVWDPFAAEADTAEHFEHAPARLLVEGSPVQPLRAARATLQVADLERSIGFYEAVIGLHVVGEGRDDPDGTGVVLSGRLGLSDLELVAAGDEPAALVRLTFVVPAGEDLVALAASLAEAGVDVVRIGVASIELVAPDGLLVELELDRAAVAASD